MNEQNNNLNNQVNNNLTSGIPNIPQQPVNNTNQVNQQPNQIMGQQNVNFEQSNPITNQFTANTVNQQPVNPVTSQFTANNINPQPSMQTAGTVPPTVNSNGTAPKKNKFLVPLIIGISILVVGLIVVLLVFVLGGKEKTMICTNTQSSYGMVMEMEAKMNFKKDKIQSVDALITVDLGSYSSYKDTFIESFEEEYSDYENDGVDVNITSDDSKIYINMKASQSNYDAVGLATSESYNEVKEELEEQGFTCK